MPTADRSLKSLVARALRPFAKVEPREVVSVLLLTLNVFLLLTAYYLLKTAREPLILLHGGAEVKSYAAAGQAVLLLLVIKVYGIYARRVGRMKLLGTLYLFFAANLVVFAALTRAGASIGVPFYLWVGIFNYTAIAQFWAFSADTYTPEQGGRLFAIVGIGSSTGAVAGARIARAVVGLGPAFMMLAAAVILVACVALFAFVDHGSKATQATRSAQASEQPLSVEGPFQLLMHDKYLLLLAGLTLVLNWCNSNGEYMLDRALLASVAEAEARGLTASVFVASFKADYFAWVNLAGVTLQLFFVSRVITRVGVRSALFVLPLVAFLGYGLVLVSPILAAIRAAKVAENSIDYSLQNTTGQALYLVTSRAEKYLGKIIVDTFMVRMGDVLSAVIVLVSSQLGLQIRALAAINLGLVGLWLLLAGAIGREHARRAAEVAALPVVEAIRA